jgi:starch phosphorylase
VEIRDEVGAENFFLFGLTAEDVARIRREGYRPRDIYHANRELRESIDLLGSGLFTHGDTALFRPLIDHLLDRDDYLLLADYQLYLDCQAQVGRTWQDQERWVRMAILNTARIGRFSSDRTIAEYCRDIWRVGPAPIRLS